MHPYAIGVLDMRFNLNTFVYICWIRHSIRRIRSMFYLISFSEAITAAGLKAAVIYPYGPC